MAYRLDRADYSSREIARLLAVSPATAWRLVSRGERLPKHIRDGVDLEVPIPERPKQKSALAKLNTLLPREKEGPVAQRREGEGPAVLEIGSVSSCGESPSPNPLPRERAPEGDAAPPAPPLQTPQPREAVKQPTRAERLWRTPLHELMKGRGFG